MIIPFWRRSYRRPASVASLNIDAEFDIEALDVYAIERCADGQTCICYRKTSGEDEEWYCDTTDERHADFLLRFRWKIRRREEQVYALGQRLGARIVMTSGQVDFGGFFVGDPTKGEVWK